MQIILQGRGNLLAKIYDILIPAFPAYFQALVVKINILDIQPHTFRHPDTGPQQKSEKRQIPHPGLIMICLLYTSQTVRGMGYIWTKEAVKEA